MAAAGFDRFLGELECPVCLLIPREGPVGACSAGHLVCKTCRVKVETCPTCRSPMPKDGTNTIFNKMIEEIAHPCKYSNFGCEVKARLVELVEHESKCPERTIKGVKTCVDCHQYFVTNDSLEKHFQEVHIKKKKCGEIFYLHQYFFSTEKTFAFYVTGDTEKSLAKITLVNDNDKRKFLANVQNVISIDSAPRDKNEVLASKDVMFVLWRQMSGFLKLIEIDAGGKTSTIHMKVDIIN